MKKRNILATILTLVLVVTIFSSMAVPAFASTTGETEGKVWAFYDGDFDSAWELYVSGDSGRASLTYGYNTFLIHEDYAWASHSTKEHNAEIITTNGTYTGPTKAAGKVSKKEIMHLAFEVFYFNFY